MPTGYKADGAFDVIWFHTIIHNVIDSFSDKIECSTSNTQGPQTMEDKIEELASISSTNYGPV